MVEALRAKGYVVREATGCSDAIAQLSSTRPAVVLLDLQLGDGQAFDVLPCLGEVAPDAKVVILTGHPTVEAAVRAIKAGADDFLSKPVSMTLLLQTVARLQETRTLSKRSVRPPSPTTASPAMRAFIDDVERLRDSDCNVLVLGETGTGKTRLARRLHAIGSRATGPFVDVNCAGLSRELFESELFGHERGAFTGAHASKAGLFEAANHGTLFLDEIGDVEVGIQPKLLKALEDKTFRRVGDLRQRSVDVRLIAATHHRLLDAVAQGKFRADLYYRISTIALTIPPLRERREDILPLVTEFVLSKCAGVSIEHEAAERLMQYPWPGNVRELKNVIERALLLRRGAVVTVDALRFDSVAEAAPPVADPVLPKRATWDDVERAHIMEALELEGGRVEAAARRLGMPRSTLYYKLKQYQLQSSRRS